MNSFFDVFRWDRSVTASAVELLFWLFSLAAVLFGAWGLSAGIATTEEDAVTGLLLISISVVCVLLGIIAARIACEAIVILFRAYGSPTAISDTVVLAGAQANGGSDAAFLDQLIADRLADIHVLPMGRIEPRAWDIQLVGPRAAVKAKPDGPSPRAIETGLPPVERWLPRDIAPAGRGHLRQDQNPSVPRAVSVASGASVVGSSIEHALMHLSTPAGIELMRAANVQHEEVGPPVARSSAPENNIGTLVSEAAGSIIELGARLADRTGDRFSARKR